MQNKWLVIVLVVFVAGAVAAQLLPKNVPHALWVQEPEAGLVLSLRGDSDGRDSQGRVSKADTPPSLQIRCGTQQTEVRLYVPIHVGPPVGGASAGSPELSLKEAFLDRERKPLPVSQRDAEWGYVWTVDGSGTYAVMSDGKGFIGRVRDKDWLSLGGGAVGNGMIAGLQMMFPIMRFGDHQARVVSACGLDDV
jgi:hypothetical protein